MAQVHHAGSLPLWITVDTREFPVVLRPWIIRIIWLIGADPNDWMMQHLGNVSHRFTWLGREVPLFVWIWMATSSSWHVKSPHRYSSLKLSDPWVILLSFLVLKNRIVDLWMVFLYQWRRDLGCIRLWPRHGFIWRYHLLVNVVLARCKTQDTFFITEEAASQVKFNGTSMTLEFELHTSDNAQIIPAGSFEAIAKSST